MRCNSACEFARSEKSCRSNSSFVIKPLSISSFATTPCRERRYHQLLERQDSFFV